MVEPRLIARILIFHKSRRLLLFLLIGNKFDGRHLVEDEVRQRRLMLIVGSTHLNAKPDALVVFLREIEHELYIVRQLEAPSSRLHFAPSRPQIELLAQGKLNEFLDGPGNVVRLNLLRATIGRDVGDQSFAKIGLDVF